MKRYLALLLFISVFIGCSSFVKPLPFSKPSLSSRVAFINSNNIEDDGVKRAIRNGNVIEGMTKDQVIASWGSPEYKDENEWHYKGWMNITVVFYNGYVIEVYGYT